MSVTIHTITIITTANTDNQITGLTTNQAIAIVVNQTISANPKHTRPTAHHTRFHKNGIIFANASNILKIIENHNHNQKIPTNLRSHVNIVLLLYAASNSQSIDVSLSEINEIFLPFLVV
ncbi:hypothetical protein IKO18_00130 [bacterium]|nr:hypothetical protein [bacterium]